MIIATFLEGDTQATAVKLHEAFLRDVDDPEEVDCYPFNGIRYQVVYYVPNPQPPQYIFLIRREF